MGVKANKIKDFGVIISENSQVLLTFAKILRSCLDLG
jgi:hypothetical protein